MRDIKYDINNPRPLPSQDRLKELLDYDPVTGAMVWVNPPGRSDLIGKLCGAKRKGGYLACSVDGNKHFVHRLAYKWMTGKEPQLIDHRNGKTADNSWHNLRSVTPQENNFNSALLSNNKTGVAGVFYHTKQDRYHASVAVNHKSIHLGSFKTVDEAAAARQGANKILGFTDRHGKAA